MSRPWPSSRRPLRSTPISRIGGSAWRGSVQGNQRGPPRSSQSTCGDPFYAPQALGILGLARYMLKEYSEALPQLQECTSRAPDMRQNHVFLAANLAQLGRLAEAQAEAAEVLRIDQKYTLGGTQRRLALFKRPRMLSISLMACARLACRSDHLARWLLVHLPRERRATSAFLATATPGNDRIGGSRATLFNARNLCPRTARCLGSPMAGAYLLCQQPKLSQVFRVPLRCHGRAGVPVTPVAAVAGLADVRREGGA